MKIMNRTLGDNISFYKYIYLNIMCPTSCKYNLYVVDITIIGYNVE